MFFDHGCRHDQYAKYLNRMRYSLAIFSCNEKHSAESNYVVTDDLWAVKMAEDINTLCICQSFCI